jgi:hypothetical protein
VNKHIIECIYMKKQIYNKYISKEKIIDSIIFDFDISKLNYVELGRNTIKLFNIDGTRVNVKSFKTPNLINKIVYRFFRKSKAQRSYEYGLRLIYLGLGTPQPIAYYELPKALFFNKSYYVSEHLEVDYTFRDLTKDLNMENHEEILRAFTRFTFKLHEHNVLFLDHSPGNTLIRKTASGYEFYLVDLNRMNFKRLSFHERIKNFERLTIHKSIVRVMSDEYAKCIDEDPKIVFQLMWNYTQDFQRKFARKKSFKKKIKFWK